MLRIESPVLLKRLERDAFEEGNFIVSKWYADILTGAILLSAYGWKRLEVINSHQTTSKTSACIGWLFTLSPFVCWIADMIGFFLSHHKPKSSSCQKIMTLLFWSSGPGKGIASESTARFNAEGRAENGEIGWRTKKKNKTKQNRKSSSWNAGAPPRRAAKALPDIWFLLCPFQTPGSKWQTILSGPLVPHISESLACRKLIWGKPTFRLYLQCFPKPTFVWPLIHKVLMLIWYFWSA